MALADTARLVAELSLDDKRFTAGAKRALGTLGKLDKGAARIGKGAGQIGAGLSKAGLLLGGAVAGGLIGAGKAAIDFDDAFQGVVKTVDEADLKSTGLSFDSLRASLLKMSQTIPISAIELSNIAANAGALGVKGKDIEGFTKVVAELGVTTNVSADDAATALGQLQNVLGLTGPSAEDAAGDFERFGAALVDLGNKGASTEQDILEVTRRAGGAAKAAGIGAAETLGWSAAIANLGLQPELAGTALQKFFVTSQVAVAKGGAKLQEFAEIAGTSAAKFRASFKKDAGGALEDFVKGLGKLPKDKRIIAIQDLFGKQSGITRALLSLSDSFETNLAPSIETANTAWEENTALAAESEKRFSTVRSQIDLLKNNLIAAGITLGEGFAPAIGRAAKKLSAFLNQDSNTSRLKALGEDIGKAIDAIDWKEVLSGAEQFVGYMKIAFDYAKRLFDAVNALPTEIKAAGLGFIGLNKLSGGLLGAGVGNVFGGLASSIAKSVAAAIPVVGKAFVQPVFVTNMPAGGLGGALPGVGGAAGSVAAGAAGFGLLTVSVLAIAPVALAALAGVIISQTDPTGERNTTGKADTASARGIPDANNAALQELKLIHGDLSGMTGSMDDERSALGKKVADLRDKIEASKIAGIGATAKVQKSADAIRDKVESGTQKNVTAAAEVRAAADRTKLAADAVRDKVESAKIAQVGATNTQGGSIVAAIHAIPPPRVSLVNNIDISATSITRVQTVLRRSGPSGGGSKNTSTRAQKPGAAP